MALAVVFAFAVADGLSPVVGAAPYDVLARQLPRILVTRLNGGGDRGVRFFPFLGPIDGQRNFLRLRELFEPAALTRLHKQGDARILCDGILRHGVLQFRVIDAAQQSIVLDCELPFDPVRPLDVLGRLEFELTGILGWTGRPHPPATLAGEALGWFLVLKDALLRREANLSDPAPDPLRAARRCVDLAPADEEVCELVLDFAAHCLRRGQLREDVASLLARLAEAMPGHVGLLERLAALSLAAGDEATAGTTAARAAALAPERADLVERAAAQLFRLGRLGEVRELVELARQRGAASASALAQLAAVCDREGDLTGRAALLAELLTRPSLPVPVARLVVSFLLEEERAAEARTVVARALVLEPQHAMLYFELGRACLLVEDTAAATAALQKALDLGLPVAFVAQARRFLRLSSVPGLWSCTQVVEKAIARSDFPGAAAAVRALVRRAGPLAEAWYLLGVVRQKVGQESRAENALRRALRRDAACADAHNRLGILLVSRGRVEEGHRHLERAHALVPSDSSALLHLAQTCAMLGRHAEAERHVLEAERLGADPRLVLAVRREVLAPRS